MVSAFFVMSILDTSFDIIHYQEVESTNTVALEMGEREAAHGTVVHADRQTGGRGRQSRFFSSPVGGLYMSIVLRPHLAGNDLPLVTLAAGIATAEAIEKLSGLPVQLKWPNDLYLNGKKLGGILTEAAPYSQETKSIPFVVTGIGVNVNTPAEAFPEPLQALATSLFCQSSREFNIDLLLKSVIAELLAEVQLLQEIKENVLAHWRNRDYLLDRELTWQDPQGRIIYGVGRGLMADGRYRLTTSQGDDYPVLSGDIQLTEINGQHIK